MGGLSWKTIGPASKEQNPRTTDLTEGRGKTSLHFYPALIVPKTVWNSNKSAPAERDTDPLIYALCHG